MKFAVLERLALEGILKNYSGSWEDTILADAIHELVKITADDVKKFEIQTLPTGQLGWNEKGEKEHLELEFSDKEKEIIKARFTEIGEQKKATRDLIKAYKKFMD